MYQSEHNDLFASIRNSRPINDGDWMATSTLMAIMGRMACYTGQEVTWDQAMNSAGPVAAQLPLGPGTADPGSRPAGHHAVVVNHQAMFIEPPSHNSQA